MAKESSRAGFLAFTALCSTLAAGCSPYVYKSEIGKYATGVDRLTSAYQSGITEADRASIEEQKQKLMQRKEALDKRTLTVHTPKTLPQTEAAAGTSTAVYWSEGCNPFSWIDSPANSQAEDKSCFIYCIGTTSPCVTSPPRVQETLAVVGTASADAEASPTVDITSSHPKKPTAPRYPQTQAAIDNYPKCVVLKDYAEGLAAITNSADRDALDAAQADLKTSAEGLGAHAGPQGASAGLLVDVFNYIAGAALDNRRYRALKAAVTSADPAVRTLGQSCGNALSNLRNARAYALYRSGNAVKSGLQGADEATYAQRIALLQGYAETLEQLRRSNPRAATDEMVKAHEELRVALADDTRQIEPVATAVGNFAKKAAALQSAFAKANSQDTAQ
jgi:hypothetical protein